MFFTQLYSSIQGYDSRDVQRLQFLIVDLDRTIMGYLCGKIIV